MLILAGYTAVVASEANFFDILLQYWAEGRMPLAASCVFCDSMFRQRVYLTRKQ